MLKLAGHSGISISVYLQDGLFAKPFGKMMRARHELFFDPLHCPLRFRSDAERDLAQLRDGVIIWTCCAHCHFQQLITAELSTFLLVSQQGFLTPLATQCWGGTQGISDRVGRIETKVHQRLSRLLDSPVASYGRGCYQLDAPW